MEVVGSRPISDMSYLSKHHRHCHLYEIHHCAAVASRCPYLTVNSTSAQRTFASGMRSSLLDTSLFDMLYNVLYGVSVYLASRERKVE